MNQDLKLQNQVDELRNEFQYGFEYSRDSLNFTSEDGDKNWANYEKLTIGYTSLGIDWYPKKPLTDQAISQEQVQKLAPFYYALISWLHMSTASLRFYPPRFFRQAEIVHGLVSIYSEKLKINALLCLGFNNLFPIKKAPTQNPLRFESPFRSPLMLELSHEDLLMVLLQQGFLEQGLVDFLIKQISDTEHKFVKTLKSLKSLTPHFRVQLDFLAASLRKIRELKGENGEQVEWSEALGNRLYHLQGMPEFSMIIRQVSELDSEWLKGLPEAFKTLCQDFSFSPPQDLRFDFPADFKLEESEQRSLAKIVSESQTTLMKSVKEKVDEFGVENDKKLKEAYAQLNLSVKLSQEYKTDVYAYYLQEASKIQWNLQDVYEYFEPLEKLELSDNDYELCEIIKEIAYCEGFAYTIGSQNVYHAGHMHPFTLWITQQCHEEMKHYHGIRALLQCAGVSTNDLDEEFMAGVFEEPLPEAYHDQYNVFNLNFLGEVHNIRAYLLLADAFENEHVHNILKWVTEDEVVHKKVFHKHFQYLCAKDPKWQKNSYECMIDTGFGTHQASHCSRYKVMMEKIGRYYARYQKTSALQFLNMSMRAQYLELKSLYSPDIFKISEFEFRKRHLKAFVF